MPLTPITLIECYQNKMDCKKATNHSLNEMEHADTSELLNHNHMDL